MNTLIKQLKSVTNIAVLNNLFIKAVAHSVIRWDYMTVKRVVTPPL